MTATKAILKPLLAAKAPAKFKDTDFPMLASPKIDGIRATIQCGEFRTRTDKTIPNKAIAAELAQALTEFDPEHLEGLDGELVVGPPNAPNTMQATTSVVMSIDKVEPFQFHVFDICTGSEPTTSRLASLILLENNGLLPDWMRIVPQQVINHQEQLNDYEALAIEQGYEGVMVRTHAAFDAPYKHGRSTIREGLLLKIKNFSDGEAEVIGFRELFHNTNEKVDGVRSTAQEGLVAGGVLGALSVRCIATGVEFEVGTGFTQAEREWIWTHREDFLGALVHFRHFAVTGTKDKPRFPSFVCFRSKDDL